MEKKEIFIIFGLLVFPAFVFAAEDPIEKWTVSLSQQIKMKRLFWQTLNTEQGEFEIAF